MMFSMTLLTFSEYTHIIVFILDISFSPTLPFPERHPVADGARVGAADEAERQYRQSGWHVNPAAPAVVSASSGHSIGALGDIE